MKLNRPSLFQITIGSLILSIKELFARSYFRAPKKVGKYLLLRNISKRNRFKNTAIAVYQHNRQLFFIKIWKGNIPDMKYYFLVDEFLSTKVLYQIPGFKKQFNFHVPRPVETIKNNNLFAAVYEYIPGKSLNHYSAAFQARVISKVIKGLSAASEKLDSASASLFPKRRPFVYVLTFPLIVLLMLIVSPEEVGVIVSSLLIAFVPLTSLFGSRLVLTHRDLTPHNVIMSKLGPYLLDCENLVLTLPGYDVTYLNSVPGYSALTKLLKEKFRLAPSRPLQAYISLQQSLGGKSHARPYLNYLRKALGK